MPRMDASAVARNVVQATASPLQELEAKYEAVLAENEDLSHQLRLEQLQRQRYEKVYHRVQEDAQSDRQSPQQMFAPTESCPAGVGRHRVTGDATAITTPTVRSDDRFPEAAGDLTTFGTDANERVRRLEQECAYLQAKVDSLRLSFRQYERGGGEGTGDGSPHDASPVRPREHARRHCADNTITDSKALEAERAGRALAEEQLTRCHATLRCLRDDAARKEVFFHTQLAALQAQNAALLEDLDAWVTAEQRLNMTAAFSPHFADSSPGAPLAPAATSTSSLTKAETMPAPPNHQITTLSADFLANRVDASILRQLERRTKGQEGLARAKGRTIVQSKGRAREVENAPAVAAGALESTPSPTATVTVYLDDLEQLCGDAHALETLVHYYIAAPAEHGVFAPSVRPTHTTTADAAPSAVSDISMTLRFVREVLPYVLSHPSRTACPSSAVKVLQPTTVAEAHRSGDILSDAAEELADLMQRHTTSTHP
ncbi:hypothetical protein, unknown function [Leishmania mexicana MHOM/GT/2001/U1103]|uniref:Uncharacterized protein n=1 Tax=Leishmania mexicana (strain MHOM/GT/2001/U1103) TaxID=929439 RepID=E9B0A1_LEIMU|nr:hypothetical protein, unknown function [Leishmania mexicana MHOM/GT/2001/U1103]CBZ28653.1 hypothetical protein, unknown function [Leishmania mexicana MHOM/GT/2001/U1103]